MALDINTFSNVKGGFPFFKAAGHPAAAPKAKPAPKAAPTPVRTARKSKADIDAMFAKTKSTTASK